MKKFLKQEIIELIWKWRVGTALLAILLMQIGYVCFRASIEFSPQLLLVGIETLHVFLSSGLFFYIFSKYYDSLIEKFLYGGFKSKSFRKNWQEVKVMYSPYSDNAGTVLRGTGEHYPREPTLLIHSSPFKTDKNDGRLLVSFNTAFRGTSGEISGKWSELQPFKAYDFAPVKRVGFPDTLTSINPDHFL